MIVLKRKEDCCGCAACESTCPKSCISMHEDAEGFLYPETDATTCINCGACEKVCPILNSKSQKSVPETQEPKVFAVQCASDELRFASSSGGMFTLLAEDVINAGGVVFGARWNADFTEVFHDFTETLEGLAAFRGSKYLQSRMGNAYRKAREFLLTGRKVLFTGTPCQIAGLRHFLRKDFPNLLAVDIACHSVPSPKVWRAFWTDLQEREKITAPTDVRFRKKVFDEKRSFWESAFFTVETSSGTAFGKPLYSTPFGRGFGAGLFSRPVCRECPFKKLGGGYKSDITIGDFWGIEKYFPKLNSKEGLSVAVCHTERGVSAIEAVKPRCKIFQGASYEQAVSNNGGFKILRRNPKREKFFKEFNSTRAPKDVAEKIREFTKLSLVKRLRGKIPSPIRRLLRLALGRIKNA